MSMISFLLFLAISIRDASRFACFSLLVPNRAASTDSAPFCPWPHARMGAEVIRMQALAGLLITVLFVFAALLSAAEENDQS